jgi:hypothetical protein
VEAWKPGNLEAWKPCWRFVNWKKKQRERKDGLKPRSLVEELLTGNSCVLNDDDDNEYGNRLKMIKMLRKKIFHHPLENSQFVETIEKKNTRQEKGLTQRQPICRWKILMPCYLPKVYSLLIYLFIYLSDLLIYFYFILVYKTL